MDQEFHHQSFYSQKPNAVGENWGKELRAITEESIEEREQSKELALQVLKDAQLIACLCFQKNPLIKAARAGLNRVEIEVLDYCELCSNQDISFLDQVYLKAATLLSEMYQEEGLSVRIIPKDGLRPIVEVGW